MASNLSLEDWLPAFLGKHLCGILLKDVFCLFLLLVLVFKYLKKNVHKISNKIQGRVEISTFSFTLNIGFNSFLKNEILQRHKTA